MDEQAERSEDSGIPLIDDPFVISGSLDASEPWRRAYAGGFRWRSIRKRAGIRDDLRLYDLRHTTNSVMSARGFDAATRGDRIGNSPQVNEGIYSHSTQDREAAAAIGDWLTELSG